MGWVWIKQKKGPGGRDGCFFLTRDVDIVIGEGVVSDDLFRLNFYNQMMTEM